MHLLCCFLFMIFCFMNNVVCLDVTNDPIVLTDQGLVRGQKVQNSNYSHFLGIPYANVDLNNPFGPFLPHPGFGEQIYNATDNTLKCPQSAVENIHLNVNNDIDCLRLNVYVPNSASSSNPLPVLAFIHGGAYNEGYSDEYGVPNVVHHDVVVVTMNYRLGVYGFLCLDSPLAAGNQGLKDQLESLRWIKRNINAFGGNPDDVTLGGLSAGSISVLLHLLSPKEKLYNKIFAMSGVHYTDDMFFEGDPDGAIKLAEFLGYSTESTEEALRFLSQVPHTNVTAAAVQMRLVTVPCPEKPFDGIDMFTNYSPYTMANPEKIRNMPILIGNTEHEFNHNSYNPNFANIFYDRLVKNFILDEEQLTIAEAITRHFYIGDEVPSSDVILHIDNFRSDTIFNYPIQKAMTDLFNDGAGPIYYYVFSYTQTGFSLHAEEVQYLFNNVWDNDDERIVSERFTELLENFVKYGNPTPQPTTLIPLTWPPISKDKRPYFVIDTEVEMKSGFIHERMAFWDAFFVAYEKYNKYELISNSAPTMHNMITTVSLVFMLFQLRYMNLL